MTGVNAMIGYGTLIGLLRPVFGAGRYGTRTGDADIARGNMGQHGTRRPISDW